MTEDILSPLEKFQEYKEKFREITEKTFQELTKISGVDIEANRTLCKEIQELKSDNKKITKKLIWWTILWAIMWLVVCICMMACFIDDFQTSWIVTTGCTVSAIMVILLLWKIHPILKKYKSIKQKQEELIQNKEREAWDMMAPLNKLYDWDILNRMITQTIPNLKFDPYFTKQRLTEFINNYGWDENFSKERSVLFSHSGLINGNPFIIARTREMEWGTKEYTGSLRVEWTTVERDSNGKSYTQHHSEILYASVYKPYPEYFEKTRLIYGNPAAPDLNFTREKNNKELTVGSKAYKHKLKEIEKFSRELKNNFAMATNEEFEVLFTTTNRDNNQQYFLLFTPLAQENIINLIRDKEHGYGDDFQFIKHHKINTITADHMQEQPLDSNPRMFWNNNYDAAKQTFIETTCENFRAIYFGFAPLFCIPMYQQIRPASTLHDKDISHQSSYWEHESLANFWGEDKFADKSCVTRSILKTTENRKNDGTAEIQVRAYGYCTEPRVDYVSRYCSNGNYYDVPVEWDEYIPVMGTGKFKIAEDAIDEQPNLDPIARLQKTQQQRPFGEDSVSRRHILSEII